MKTKQLLAIMIMATATFSACKKDDKKTTPVPESCTNNGYLKFLKTGNKMEYNYLDLATDDTTLTIEYGAQASDGSYKMLLTGGGSFTSGNPTRYIKECNDWLVVSTSPAPTYATNKTYPLIRKPGDKWTVSGVNNYTVVATGVSVTTDAGTFICDKFAYNQTGTFNTDTIYFSNEYGYIKYEGFLLEYSLKSKNF